MADVLVTGGAGYIGSHTVLALRDAGHSVTVLDDLSTGRRFLVPPGVKLVVADVGDAAALRRVLARRCDAIIHFAGSISVPESVENPLKYYRNNTTATATLVEAAIAAKVRSFVFSSTAAVYGVPSRVPLDESCPTVPINPYGASKLAAEWILRDAAAAGGLGYVILRYFNVAGADARGRAGPVSQNSTNLIKAACETAAGKRPDITIFGDDYDTPDGTGVRDFIHVTDLADIHVAALGHLAARQPSAILNCGYGRGFSVKQVLRTVEEEAGRKLAIHVGGRRAGDPPAVIAATDLLARTFGWRPRHDDLRVIIGSALAWEKSLPPERRPAAKRRRKAAARR